MLVCPVLPSKIQIDRNKVMAPYTLCLAQGITILRTKINSITINRHLNAASSIPLHRKQLEPLLDTCGLKAQCIKDVLSDVKRWKYMTTCRCAITVKMMLCIREKCKNKYPDILESVLYD